MFLQLSKPDAIFAAKAVAVSAGLAGICYVASSKLGDLQERRRLTKLRKRKQQECAETLKELKDRFTLDPNRVAIVNLPFDVLVTKLQRRELKAREVLEAFIAKSVTVTSEFNCITEFVPQCLERADELDASAEVKGPLHGVPFCVKDDNDIDGMDSTLGMSINLYKAARDTCVVVKVLMDAGAIPFCKTNLSHTTISGASDNPIYGTTFNPHNKALSPGGSSSGTGCLVAAGGAPFGTGSDFGGSVRIPANACGLATLKPTIRRNSSLGMKQAMEDVAGIASVPGIIASDVKVLTCVNKVLWSNGAQSEYDPITVPLTWNEQLLKSTKPLRVGFYTSLPVFPAFPDVSETVLKAKAALESLGHTVVEFPAPPIPKIMWVFFSLLNAEGGNQLYNALKHDKISHIAEKLVKGRYFPSNIIETVRSLFTTADERLFGGDPKAQKSEVLWNYLKQLRLLKYEMLDEMRRLEVDVLLAPVLPLPAMRVFDAEDLINLTCCYTAMWNGLDFPAGVLPFGKESGLKVDEYDDKSDYFFKLAKENVKAAKGMPIGVQIIARPFQEELVLRVLNELESSKTAK